MSLSCSVCLSALSGELCIPCSNMHKFHKKCLLEWATVLKLLILTYFFNNFFFRLFIIVRYVVKSFVILRYLKAIMKLVK